MMPKPLDIPIVGASNAVPQDDPQFTLNLYAEKVSDSVYTLKPTPGDVVNFALTGTGGGRNQITVADRYFAVRGGLFVEEISGVTTVWGELLTIHNKCALIACLPPNGEGQILIVDADHGYVFELATNTYTLLTEADHGWVGGRSQAAFCGGRAIVLQADGTQFRESDLYNFLSWPGLAFAACQSLNTPLQSVVSDGHYCYFFATDGFEGWEAVDTVPQSLQLVYSGNKIGTLAPNSPYIFENYVYFLGANTEGKGVIYRYTRGGRPTPISDYSTNRQIANFADASDCNIMCYQSLGHRFVIANFTSANVTLCYDATEDIWHNRCIRDVNNGGFYVLPYISIITYRGLLTALDSRNGNVYTIDNNVFTNNGAPIVRDRILSPVPENADWMTFLQSIELFCEVGNTPVDQNPPQAMLRIARDRGEEYGLEDWCPMGSNNSYETRVRWTGLGSAFSFTLWFRIVASQYISLRKVRLRAQ